MLVQSCHSFAHWSAKTWHFYQESQIPDSGPKVPTWSVLVISLNSFSIQLPFTFSIAATWTSWTGCCPHLPGMILLLFSWTQRQFLYFKSLLDSHFLNVWILFKTEITYPLQHSHTHTHTSTICDLSFYCALLLYLINDQLSLMTISCLTLLECQSQKS